MRPRHNFFLLTLILLDGLKIKIWGKPKKVCQIFSCGPPPLFSKQMGGKIPKTDAVSFVSPLFFVLISKTADIYNHV